MMENRIFIDTFVEIYNEFDYSVDVKSIDCFCESTWECLRKLMNAYSLSPMTKIIILAGIHRDIENEDVKDYLEFQIDCIQTFLD